MSELKYKVMRGQGDDAIHTHSMRGHVHLPYAELLAILGKPSWTAPKGASRVMWRLYVDEVPEPLRRDWAVGGVVIYDWMSDPHPLEDVDKWSVASEDRRGLGAAQHIIINKLKPRK